jgi:arylsulfatase A-like enzyme
MPSPRRALWTSLALLIGFGACLPPAVDAKVPVVWARKRLPKTCEPPHRFYSSAHVPGAAPCCPMVEGACAGGAACPPSGVCPGDGKACMPDRTVERPNIILFVSDDHGACHYGASEECRSTQTGSPLPAPRTPNLDLLAGHGTVFPVAHNTAGWCFPSLASTLTGRHQKTFTNRKVNDLFYATIPNVLRKLEGDPNAVADPFNAGNAIGGYCTMLAGKFIAALDETTFDARAKSGNRTLGRNACVAGPPGSAPRCGTSVEATYAPFTTGRATDVFNFLDMLLYRVPGSSPAEYRMQNFFVWYAPRIPHAPLRAPDPVRHHLFGGLGAYPRGGLMNLAQWCTGGTCAPVVQAFDEVSSGTGHEFYANVWWGDDNIRELRKFLALESAPHCIGADGRSRFDVTNPASCPGTWSGVAPDLPRNTVFMHLADNGWHLPRSKHAYTENGYRTALYVFDPRTLPEVPHWDPEQAGPPPPARKSEALAHTNDALPTALGLALGTPGSQACPVGPDGRACDGRDLRPHLADAPGGPAPIETLRRATCGHETNRPTSPTANRFLVTRPGSVGRCVRATSPACATTADCGAGEFCLGGLCAPAATETTCATTATCPAGAACLGGRCRSGPPCADTSDCTGLLGAGYVCEGREQRWCRNDPNVACSTSADCPACPSVAGNAVPCKRLCEARTFKLYASPGTVPGPELVDLFLDPDEHGLHSGSGALIKSMSTMTGPYASTIRRLNCCIDEWWPEIAATAGSLCSAGFSCPADFSCVQ